MAHLWKPGVQFANGATILGSGTINCYKTGTTNDESIFTDNELTAAATNPIVLGSNGLLPTEIHGAGYYTILIKDSSGSTVDTVDDFLVTAQNAKTATDGDVNPTVRGTRILTTGNTSSTTIDDLDDGYTGQEVIVVIGDALTTFDFSSSSLKGNGSINRLFDNGDWIKCVLNGTDWYCDIQQGTTSGSKLTIASGVITVTHDFHTVEVQSASSDDLVTINGGYKGYRLTLVADDATEDIVLKDGSGNLQLSGDFTLDHNQDTIDLIYDGSNWLQLSESSNA